MKTIAQQLNVKEFSFEIKDKNGNKLYHENSDGFWVKREFDKNNNEVYYEYSSGYWEKREYDKNNNEVYFENSKGTIIDKRSKKCTNKVVTIDGVDYELKEVKTRKTFSIKYIITNVLNSFSFIG